MQRFGIVADASGSGPTLERVLLVEDSPFDTVRSCELLGNGTAEAFALDCCESLRDALEALSRRDYDVVLLDLNLPDSAGLDTLRRLQRRHTDVPVVVMTMVDDADVAVAALNAGAQDYVIKAEADASSLRRALRYAIERNRTLRALALARERERFLATHDALTGLPNRALFLDRLSHALEGGRRRRRRVTVMFLDVDHFKSLNDTLGHTVGDAVLKLVAETLRGCIRSNDTPARTGGDEFALLLEDVAEGHDVTRVAQEIARRLGRPRIVLGQEVFVTTSIGIATFPDDGESSEALMRNADAAMYHVKENGRDGYAFFSEEMDARARRHLALQGDLRDSVLSGQLTCHYQPQVDMEGKVVGAEALARWRHPRLGWIGPDEFVPLAERRGLVVPMGEHILGLACAATRNWARERSCLRMAVNVAVRQLAHQSFADRVRGILEKTGVPPDRLELEITESTLMEDRGPAIAALRDLRGLGVRVSIDDFGTGYSCLRALKNLPVDAIKIDQSFVRGCLEDPADTAIIRTIIGVAKDLGLDTVAEGVGTPEQRDLLQELGCRIMQGYLFGRPVPAEAFGRRFLARAAALGSRAARVGAAARRSG